VASSRSAELAARFLHVLGAGAGEVAAAPPGDGVGFWAGGPSAAVVDDTMWLAYRLRRPVDQGRGFANVIARSADGVHFDETSRVSSAEFGAASLERPALVPLPNGGFRLFVSCSTWQSKHWWVEAIDLDEAGRPTERRQVVLPGDAATAWKDVVVHRTGDDWQMWACRHPLDGGDDEADRMSSWYATSSDGLHWDFVGEALGPTPGRWDARGARIASVLRLDGEWTALYDGRASSAENWHERTGVAFGESGASFRAAGDPTLPGATARYLSVATLPDGYRLYWEASRVDGAHDLRTAYVPRLVSLTQS
jgi:hypothetical protein